MNYRLSPRGLLVSALALAFGSAQGAIPPSASVQSQIHPEKRHSVIGTVTKPIPAPISAEVANPELARKRLMQQLKNETPCRMEDFAAARGDVLVRLVRSQSVSCVNQLFSVTGQIARDAFSEAQMVNIAAELKRQAQSYDGTNSGQIQQLVSFMRAGYFVQWYQRDDVGEYGPTLKAAIRGALDVLFENPATRKVTAENGDLLSEAITLIDSAAENARYLPVVLDLLKRADDSYFQLWSMRSAVNNVFTVLYRGHQNDDFVEVVRNDPKIVEALTNFYRQRLYLRGTESEFVLVNAVREGGRFMKYTERKPEAQALMRMVLQENEMVGRGAMLWVTAAGMIDFFDSANCNYYGTCNYKEALKAKVLPNRYECSPSLKMLAQDMTIDQFKQSCAIIGAEEKLFHYGMLGSSNPQTSKPVPNDKNTALEVVVFDDYSNYSNYAGLFYGISTNNGGMYLEGNPSDPNNQARFIAHEASWNRPKFQVWNLEHEYIHYQDGRYDMEGDFTKTISAKTVWWVEGVAEYYSRQNDYPEAITEARKKTYTLSTILGNTYEMGDYTNRAYRWGYLAVRFMFERHRDDVERAVAFTRTGDYAGYTTHMNGIGSRYDAEFTQWLDLVSSSGDFAGGKPSNSPPALTGLADTRMGMGQSASVGFTVTDKETPAAQLRVAASTNNPTLFPTSGLVLGGSDGQRTLRLTPSAGKQGTAQITLTVTDGQLSTSGTFNVTVGDGGGSGSCPANPDALGDGCTRMVNGPAKAYYYVYVPPGTRRLSIKTYGGTGNADLYAQDSKKGWPSESNYLVKSTQPGNDESIVINSPAVGYYHLLVNPQPTYSGLSLMADLVGEDEYSESNCPADAMGLADGCLRSKLSGNSAYYWIYAPSGTKRITLRAEGGQASDATLYVKTVGWPTPSDYLFKSQAGTLVINNLPSGDRYYHILLQGKTPYQGVNLKARVD
ncbi:collagenase [Chitinimonas sp. PSY-7]|uniref:collagenase n=1 Tax=Chitinimonas sp. PSY-7 TaxID=3459088 RepID=UPI004040165D